MRYGVLRVVCVVAALSALFTGTLRAQRAVTLTVAEEGGIRRTQFPARARVDFARGQLRSAEAIRLVAGDAEVPAQGTAVSTWQDGSVRTLEVDFNLSIGPLETASLRLSYGAGIGQPEPPRRGLTVAEEGGGLQVGRIRFGRSGDPLLLSVAYREELVVEGRNGIAVVDTDGSRYDRSNVRWAPVEVLKAGPLVVHLRYQGALALPAGGEALVTVDAEMPVSKSWVKLTAAVTDERRRLRAVVLETPLSLGEHPWTWDVGTRNGTYGAMRSVDTSVIFSQRIFSDADAAWTVRTGPPGEERPYERSAPGRADVSRGWAHLQSAREAVAFAVARVGESAGTWTVTLNGAGQTTFGFEPAERRASHSLTVYQHYVSIPVPIGAATSPASILSPLRVTVD